MIQSRVLITGFGPFPGVADNVSGRLAERLARSVLAARLGERLHAEVLPTAWEEVSLRAPCLLNELKPRLVLHLGVNQRARSFRIERSAHNRIAAREDARGSLPKTGTILAQAQSRIDTRLPATHLAKHLRGQGVPAVVSRSAGTYLCNFLYYLSLDWALRQEGSCDVCFVHVPPGECQGGALSETELLRGAELILGYLLAHAGHQDGMETGHRRSLTRAAASQTG